MTEMVSIDFRKSIGTFPLEGCALLPHTTLPLHIFEPRYVSLLRHALDSDGLIAMAMFDMQPDQAEYLHGRPALREVACIGYVSQYEKLEDERYLIVLQGALRARMLSELKQNDYRSFLFEPIEDVVTDRDAVESEREKIVGNLEAAMAGGYFEMGSDDTALVRKLPADVLVDVAGAAAAPDAQARYALLCEPDVLSRARLVAHYLDALGPEADS